MAASKVSLKLLIDKKAKKVLFAEADKNFIDFLFNILSLPLGTVIRLLGKQEMVGCLGNLYDSIENLSQDYMQPNQNKDDLLKPKAPITGGVPLLLHEDTAAAAAAKRFYRCTNSYNMGPPTYQVHNYVTENPQSVCPSCNTNMSVQMTYVAGPAKQTIGRGFVKEVVTYMVMDDLVVKPMSTISSITLLNKFNVKDVGALEEKMVDLDMAMGLKLLKESLYSQTVLTSVLLGNI